MYVQQIAVSAVDTVQRIRRINAQRVAALKVSLSDVGLLNPINVYVGAEGRYVLAAGAHRLQAVRELGWEVIAAHVMEGGDVDRKLVEIDENLCRSELTPAERAQHEARRKELWPLRHLASSNQTAKPLPGNVSTDATACVHGSRAAVPVGQEAPASGEMGGKSLPAHPKLGTAGNAQVGPEDSCGRKLSRQQQVGFAASTAAITGESKRAINLNVRRGEVLGGDALRNITNTSLDKGVELDALMQLQRDERRDLVQRARSGENVSAKRLLAAKAMTPIQEHQAIAKRAIAALAACAMAMDDGEFDAALDTITLPIRAVHVAEVIARKVALARRHGDYATT